MRMQKGDRSTSAEAIRMPSQETAKTEKTFGIGRVNKVLIQNSAEVRPNFCISSSQMWQQMRLGSGLRSCDSFANFHLRTDRNRKIVGLTPYSLAGSDPLLDSLVQTRV